MYSSDALAFTLTLQLSPAVAYHQAFASAAAAASATTAYLTYFKQDELVATPGHF